MGIFVIKSRGSSRLVFSYAATKANASNALIVALNDPSLATVIGFAQSRMSPTIMLQSRWSKGTKPVPFSMLDKATYSFRLEDRS